MRSHVTKTVSACFAVPHCGSYVAFVGPFLDPFSSHYISRPDAAGLRKLNPRWHRAVPSQPASVGDELSCPTSVRLVEVRPCRSTSPSTALVDGSGANRFQARSPCLQVQHGTAPLYLADELRQPADCDARRRLRSASSPITIADCPPYAAVNHRRRSSFPGRRCKCLERFAAPRHVGTSSLPQSPQDAPLQALLSIMQFRCCEVTLVIVGHINRFFLFYLLTTKFGIVDGEGRVFRSHAIAFAQMRRAVCQRQPSFLSYVICMQDVHKRCRVMF